MLSEKQFESLLNERHFEPAGAGLEERIIASAKDRRSYIFSNAVDTFKEFVISVMPARAPVVTFAVILLVGLAIGVSLPTIKGPEMAVSMSDEEVL